MHSIVTVECTQGCYNRKWSAQGVYMICETRKLSVCMVVMLEGLFVVILAQLFM